MRVIPVIDLKGGQVVRGIAGQRSRYRPIVSLLASDSRPHSIATAFVRRLGASEVYVADLDAIAGQEPDWAAYEQIAAAGLRLWVDAGIGEPGRARELAHWAANGAATARVVVGLESVSEPAQLPAIQAALPPQAGVFSLDLQHGAPWTRSAAWQSVTPHQIAAAAVAAGFQRLLVLDLASVGVGQGPASTGLCRELRDAYPQIELLMGGGVRGAEDLRSVAASGCDAVLVASALHDGRLTAADLAAVGGLSRGES
jgi:phosphoribosylformimino-5-aminoimidazole carboxamide ribotide isomerase